MKLKMMTTTLFATLVTGTTALSSPNNLCVDEARTVADALISATFEGNERFRDDSGRIMASSTSTGISVLYSRNTIDFHSSGCAAYVKTLTLKYDANCNLLKTRIKAKPSGC